jgi:hypothetical protein
LVGVTDRPADVLTVDLDRDGVTSSFGMFVCEKNLLGVREYDTAPPYAPYGF